MKRILFLFALVILFSGCSKKEEAVNNGEDLQKEAFDKIEDMRKSQEKKSEEAQKINGVTETINNNQSNINNMEKQRTLEIHKDLAQEYKGAILKTNLGDIEVLFYSDESPVTVNNFMNLAQEGFYNGTKFHRVIKDFMIQGGDPNSKEEDWATHGMGGPEYRFDDEFNNKKLVRGNIAMANAGPGTNGSQFFIVTAPATPHLDGKHTNFGEVVAGMSVVDDIEGVKTNGSYPVGNDHPLEDVVVESIELVKK